MMGKQVLQSQWSHAEILPGYPASLLAQWMSGRSSAGGRESTLRHTKDKKKRKKCSDKYLLYLARRGK